MEIRLLFRTIPMVIVIMEALTKDHILMFVLVTILELVVFLEQKIIIRLKNSRKGKFMWFECVNKIDF